MGVARDVGGGAGFGTFMLVAFGLLARSAAAEDDGWRTVAPETFPIVSRFAAFSEPPLAKPDRNQLGGQTISVKFRYEGDAFALVVYNESPQRLSEPSIEVAAEHALGSYSLFKDGDFVLGGPGMADSALGPFAYEVVHARQPVGSDPLLSCAVFHRTISAGMAALTGFFCGHSEAFTPDRVNVFFATLGIRGIALPK
jgi:hypothetical protein